VQKIISDTPFLRIFALTVLNTITKISLSWHVYSLSLRLHRRQLVKNLDEMFQQLQITHVHATLFSSCLSLPIISQDADSTEYGQSSITPEIALDFVVFNDGTWLSRTSWRLAVELVISHALSDGLQPFVNES
jgi:hypothetical protein